MDSNSVRSALPGTSLPAVVPTGVPTDLNQYFKHHSRSFSFAARFFTAADRERVCRLYAFCRITDDIVDEAEKSGPPQYDAQEAIAAWKQLVRQSFDGTPSGIPWLDQLMRESRAAQTPFELIGELFKGVESDLTTVRISTEEELDAYAYRVGSVVGIWMCYLLGVQSARMHDFAAALGSAMQITNILRDVGQDLDANRVYIPAVLLSRYGLTIDDVVEMKRSGSISENYVALLRHLMDTADSRYERAWEGLVRLPPRFGLAASIASGVYRGIHREIIRNRYNNLTRRARTSSTRKLLLAMTSWCRLRELRRDLSSGRANVTERPIPGQSRFSPLAEKNPFNHSYRD